MRAFKPIWLAALLWPLAACDDVGLGTADDPNVVEALALYDGAVVVRGPRGYCVDADNVRRQPSSRLVFLGSCESLSGEPGVTVPLALIAVNVAGKQSGRTQPAAATIAASAAPKKPLAAIDADGLALVHLDAGGELALLAATRATGAALWSSTTISSASRSMLRRAAALPGARAGASSPTSPAPCGAPARSNPRQSMHCFQTRVNAMTMSQGQTAAEPTGIDPRIWG